MAIHVRQRGNTQAFELRIKHKLLPKTAYFTLSSEQEARDYGQQVEGFLLRGIVPEGLCPESKVLFKDIGGAIRAYEKACGVPSSTSNVLCTVHTDIGKTELIKVDYRWAESWVREQKLTNRRGPITIRHHVGALSRCFNWVVNCYPTHLADNPLPRLPRGYSTCNESERRILALNGFEAKEDCERDRRLANEEEINIVKVLQARVAAAATPTEKAEHQGHLLMFLLALETSMRMREIYTLSARQIDIEKRTIFLTKTKNGDKREIPLSSVAITLLESHLRGLARPEQDTLILPYWNGCLDTKTLDATTSQISRDFAEIFAEAGCPDFVFHDTRHEGICRLVLRTTLSVIEISRITGHRDLRSLRRYMSLRGSELAAKLW